MSGVEIAGLALSVIPLINQAMNIITRLRSAHRRGLGVVCGLVATGSGLELSNILEDVLQTANFQKERHDGLDSGTYTVSTYFALCAFATSTTQLYHLHNQDQHQQRYLMGGITTGVFGGLAAERDLQRAMLRVMPWTILLSLAISVFAHRLWHGSTNFDVDNTTLDSCASNNEKIGMRYGDGVETPA